MKWIKPSLYFVVFSLPLYLFSVLTAQVQAQSYYPNKTWQISQAFKPPQRGKPPASADGSTRGMAVPIQMRYNITSRGVGARQCRAPTGVPHVNENRYSSCLTGKKRITPLIPPDKLGLTFAQHPTFFWYVL